MKAGRGKDCDGHQNFKMGANTLIKKYLIVANPPNKRDSFPEKRSAKNNRILLFLGRLPTKPIIISSHTHTYPKVSEK